MSSSPSCLEGESESPASPVGECGGPLPRSEETSIYNGEPLLLSKETHQENGAGASLSATEVTRDALESMLEQQKKETEKLQREVNRLQEEKVTATEIFSETISKYENDITELEVMINSLKEDKQRGDGVTASSTRTSQAPLQLAVPTRGRFSSGNRESIVVSTATAQQQAIERRPFMAVASSFMSGWMGGGTGRHHHHRARSPSQPSVVYDGSPTHSQVSSSIQSSNSPTPPTTGTPRNSDNLDNQDHTNLDDQKQHLEPPSSTHAETQMSPRAITTDSRRPSAASLPCSPPNPAESNSNLSPCDSPRPSATKQGGGGNTFWKSLIGMRPLAPPPTPAEAHGSSDSKERDNLEAWTTAVANWEAHKSSKRFQKMLQQGIPYSMRGAVWKKAIGDRLLITRALYLSTVQRVRVFREFLMRTSKRYKNRLEETLGAALLAEDSYNSVSERLTTAFDNGQPSDPFTPSSTERVKSSRIEATDNISDCQSGIHFNQQQQPACDLCTLIWTPSIISAFETISADLHRTLPRLGVVPAAPQQKISGSNNNMNNDSGTEKQAFLGEVEQPTEPQKEQPVSDASADSSRKAERPDALPESNSACAVNDLSTESDFQHSEAPSLSVRSEDRTMKPSCISNGSSSSTEVGVRPLPVALCGRDGQQLYSRLRLLLETFVLFRPDVGYVQGMGFIAAMLLLYIDDDYEAFSCFANLLSRQSLLAFYTFDLRIVDVYFKTFDALLTEKIPAMAEALNEAQIPSSQFLVDWMYTLFTRCLPFELVCRIWDLYLVQGDIILFQISLGMLKHFQLEEANNGPLMMERLSTFLSSSSTTHFESIQPDRFLEVAASVAPQRDRLLRVMKAVQQANKEKERRHSQQCAPTSSNSGVPSMLRGMSQQQISSERQLKPSSPPIELPQSTESLPLFDSTMSSINYTIDRAERRTSGVGAIKRSARSFLGHRRSTQQVTIDLGEDASTTPASSVERSADWRHSDSLAGASIGDPSCEDSLQQSSSAATAMTPATSTTPATSITGAWMTPGSALYGRSVISDRSSTMSPDWFAPSAESAHLVKSKRSSTRSPKSSSAPSRETSFRCDLPPHPSPHPTPLRRLRSTPTSRTPKEDDFNSSTKSGHSPIRRAETSRFESSASSEDQNPKANDVSQKRLRRQLSPSPDRFPSERPRSNSRRNVLRIFQGSNHYGSSSSSSSSHHHTKSQTNSCPSSPKSSK